ncbi:VaFE repeat-containing surface-anchored protein [Candidatus Saccharibacteria bacterium]|nr:VaFE repeat-containing surface-anchored protein [Candidatus Saccharibacteria bacterium]
MFVLSRKGLLKRALLVFVGFVLAGLAMFAIIKHVQNKVSANTPSTGGSVQVAGIGPRIEYGGWSTNRFTIKSGDSYFQGVCADPKMNTPELNVSYGAEERYNVGDFQYIKLMLYIFFVNTPSNQNIINGMFQDTPDPDDRFAYVHAFVGWLNTNKTDTSGLEPARVVWLEAVYGQLGDLIIANDSVWQEASQYKLYITTNNDGNQRIMWIEAPTTGTLTVNKVDADTNSCTTTTSNLSLNGTTFALLDASGNTISTKSIAAGTCGVVFENVPYGNYTVRETVAATGYTKDTDKSVVMNIPNLTITLSNAPIKGKITVNKIDADTGTCTTTGSLSYDGTAFTLINSTGGPVKYGNESIPNGGTIGDAKTLTSPNCSVEFSDLPYGTYTIRESSVATGYTGDTDKTVTLSGASASVSFSNAPKKGKIIISKTDKDLGSCAANGNASLVGTVFDIYNKTGGEIKYGGNKIANGAKIVSKTISAISNNACGVEFDNLPYGKYEVREASVSVGYTIDTPSKEVTLAGDSARLAFTNTGIKGKVTVNKVDTDTGSCTNSDGLSFAGVRISITNNSTNSVYYGGLEKKKGDVIATKTMSDGDCDVTFENLPYGTYIIKEEATSEGYVLNTEAKTVTIPTNNSVNVSTTVANQPIRGDIRFVKMDSNNNVPMRDVLFSISAIDENNQILESHIVVSNDEGVVDTSSSFILHSINTNGYDALYDEVEPFFFSGYGTWFGRDKNGASVPVRDTVGALPYGTYLIQELRCGSNLFCTGILNQKKTVTINSANQVVDLGDWDNACTKFSLGTTATDAEDGDHYIEISKEAKIIDKIEYCVKPNTNFVIKGILMDKSTGEPLLINGETVESSVDLRSEEDCGETEMEFIFDASELGGKEVVVFETLWYKDDIITRHNDINDLGQTVELISLRTYATNAETGDKLLPLNEDVEIKDTVKYCLKPGIEYTVKGVLMNKKTGNGVLVNSEPVEAETVFTPDEACGETEMIFKLNTADLGGVDLVIFESLYIEDELILEHKDINNADETVSVMPPAPDTGLFTRLASEGAGGGQILYVATGIVIVSVGGYLVYRLGARKRFMKKM